MGTNTVRRGATAETVSENVKRLRQARNLGLRAFADKLSDIGWPLGHSAVDKIEKGTRRVDVDDLVALAIALDTSPAELLTPHVAEVDSPVKATATKVVAAHDLARWIRHYPIDPAFPSDAERAPGGYWEYLKRRIKDIETRYPEVLGTIFELEDLAQLREMVNRGND